jgi:hypothetical protein
MGDHRASIKIEVDFHGFKDKADMWINYCDSDGNGVDSRITEFFGNMYEKGMAKYHADQWEYEEEKREREQEEKDRKEFERLKAKYESNG